MSPRSCFFLVLVMLNAGVLCAQEGASVRTTVSKTRVQLGEPFEWEVEIRQSLAHPLPVQLPDSLPPFERRGALRRDSQQVGEYQLLKTVYTLAAFDSGHWVLPAIPLGPSLRSDTLGVDVYFTFTDTARAFHDLKDIVTVPSPPASRRWWYLLAGGLLLIALLAFLVLRMRKTKVAEKAAVVPLRDPLAEALAELEQLRAEQPANKAYYTRLIDIVRLYLFRRFGLLSLQQTSDDLLRQLAAQFPGTRGLQELTAVLQQGDMTKFARYEPTSEERKTAMLQLENFIRELENQNRPAAPSTT